MGLRGLPLVSGCMPPKKKQSESGSSVALSLQAFLTAENTRTLTPFGLFFVVFNVKGEAQKLERVLPPPAVRCKTRGNTFPGRSFCHQPVDRCRPAVLREGRPLGAACMPGPAPGWHRCARTGLGATHVTQDRPRGQHVHQDGPGG